MSGDRRYNPAFNGAIHLAFFDAWSLSVWPRGSPVSMAIAVMPTGAYLGDAGLSGGGRVCISSVRRFDASAIPTTGKACGQYVNSVRAVQEAMRRGFDEAIFLNQRGEVAEGTGENLFLVTRLQKAFFDVVHGRDPAYRHSLAYVT